MAKTLQDDYRPHPADLVANHNKQLLNGPVNLHIHATMHYQK
ncbi:MAG: hypothetical protein RIQ94_2859 [Pseudomonadota bacterium]